MVYRVEGTAGPKKKDYFSLKKISSKLGVVHDITPTSLGDDKNSNSGIIL